MPRECLCGTLRRATRAITKFYSDRLARSGLNATQFAQLVAISQLEQSTIGRVAVHTDLDRSTLGRNVRVLERMGLVRLGAGSDERTREIALTKAGERALKSATPLWVSVQDTVARRLGPRRTEQLFRLLDDLAHAAR